VWDLSPSRRQPLQQVVNAHLRDCSNTSTNKAGLAGHSNRAGASGRRRNPQGSPSVTSVVFIDEYVLASAGANDGAVKLWDLRKSWNHDVSWHLEEACRAVESL
jgi:WD40 repeat protein